MGIDEIQDMFIKMRNMSVRRCGCSLTDNLTGAGRSFQRVSHGSVDVRCILFQMRRNILQIGHFCHRSTPLRWAQVAHESIQRLINTINPSQFIKKELIDINDP